MKHIMLDLETLGVNSRAPIVSIGAIKFNPFTGEMGEEFYAPIDVAEYQDRDEFTMDFSTLKWWMNQDQAVIRSTFPPNAMKILDALELFTEYCKGEKYEIWGNGSDFDNVLLGYAYDVMKVRRPWPFWCNRCYRTLKNIYAIVPAPNREGMHHNALDDAVFQAHHLVEIYKFMGMNRS